MAFALEKMATASAGSRAALRIGEAAVGAALGSGAMYAAGRGSGKEGVELRNETLLGALGGTALGAAGAAGARRLAERRFRDAGTYRRVLNDEIVQGAKRFLSQQDARAAQAKLNAAPWQAREDRLKALVGRIDRQQEKHEQMLYSWRRLALRRPPDGSGTPTAVAADALREALGGAPNATHRLASDLAVIRAARDPAQAKLTTAEMLNARARGQLARRLQEIDAAKARASQYVADPGLALSKKLGIGDEILAPMRAKAELAEAADRTRARQRAAETFFGLGGR